MWGLAASALDELIAFNLRWTCIRRTSHRTDREALVRLVSELEAGGPTAIFPPFPPPAEDEVTIEGPRAEWGGDLYEIRMPSPWDTSISANRVLWMRVIFPRGKSWGTPITMLVHPWIGPGIGTVHSRHGIPLLERGIAVALPTLPHHFERCSPRRWNGELSICGDLLWMIDSARQTMADMRRLVAWLRAQGTRQIGVTGISLGGGVAAMLAATDPEMAFAAPLIPPVESAFTLRKSALTRGPMRRDFEASNLDDGLFDRALGLISPGTPAPLLSPEQLLVVGCRHDRIIPPATFERLAERWGCELWMLSHSHCSLFLSLRIKRRLADWIAERMEGNGG
jgi:pimeloyl-ACP methyl ester carboxylesterase